MNNFIHQCRTALCFLFYYYFYVGNQYEHMRNYFTSSYPIVLAQGLLDINRGLIQQIMAHSFPPCFLI